MKKLESPKVVFALSLALFGINLASAQDMDVQGDGSNGMIILQGKNINPSLQDNIALQGYSAPAGYWGIGVKGVGGWYGVQGYANTTGNNGSRTGLYGSASNGTLNYGLQADASGSVGTNYGVYGTANGVNCIAVYGSASTTYSGSAAGYFNGNLKYTGSLTHVSDERLKKNILPLRNCLYLVKMLSPKEYDYRTDEFPAMNLPATRQMGLIAQDVETVLPNLVEESLMPVSGGQGKDKKLPVENKPAEKFKAVNYMDLIPVLIGAIKEQQNQIEDLRAQIAQLKQ